MGLFAVLFSDVSLPELAGMVGSAEVADVDTSTDEVATVLVDVEDKTVEEDMEVIVESTEVDVTAADVVLAESDTEVELALGACGSSVESESQEVYTAAYSTSSMFP